MPFLALLLAPFIGSFLGVVVQRLPTGQPLLFARSACDHCNQPLTARDLIPLASWLARRGRCRCGDARLSPFYPGIELAALAVALMSFWATEGWLFWPSLALGWTLLVLALIDQRHLILPDILTLPLIPAGFFVTYLDQPHALPDHLIGALAAGLGFAAIAWLYRHFRGHAGLGQGDAKLFAAAGAWLGWQALPSTVVLAALALLAVAMASTLTGAKLARTTRLPFGPYLAAAFWLVWLFGPPLAG